MSTENLSGSYKKAANYSLLSILAANTLSTMGRFKRIPNDVLMTKVYNAIKARAAKK